jgi:Domain of unknown function (DUF4389)
MAFAGPSRQRRVTVLFRLLLAIPQLIVLYVLSLVAELVAIVGWFAALFTGRLPAGLADFLTSWLRWSARVGSYLALLTDSYPPFEMADADYPVRVSVTPGRLNRLAVLFRIILALPVAVLVVVLGYGSVIIGFVTWLIVLITGTMPVPLYQAIAAVTRYGIRYYGYFFLLSGTYPGGLFGDPADTDVAAGWAPANGQPVYGQQPDAGPATAGPLTAGPLTDGPQADGLHADGPHVDGPLGDAQPGPGQPGSGQPGSGETLLLPGWPAGPEPWRLVLSSAAKRLVGLFIAVGAVAVIAYGVLIGIATSNSSANVSRAAAISSISAAHSTLLRQLSGLSQQISACQNQSAQAAALTCVTKFDRQAAGDLGTFANAVRSTPVPAPASAAAAQLTVAADQLQTAFQQLGKATSVAQYEQIDSSAVAPKVTQFNDAYVRLGQALQAR